MCKRTYTEPPFPHGGTQGQHGTGDTFQRLRNRGVIPTVDTRDVVDRLILTLIYLAALAYTPITNHTARRHQHHVDDEARRGGLHTHDAWHPR